MSAGPLVRRSPIVGEHAQRHFAGDPRQSFREESASRPCAHLLAAWCCLCRVRRPDETPCLSKIATLNLMRHRDAALADFERSRLTAASSIVDLCGRVSAWTDSLRNKDGRPAQRRYSLEIAGSNARHPRIGARHSSAALPSVTPKPGAAIRFNPSLRGGTASALSISVLRTIIKGFRLIDLKLHSEK